MLLLGIALACPAVADATFPGANGRASDVDPDWQPIVGYARPKSATPMEVKLVPASKACTSSNTSHGVPLAVPSCNPPVQASDYLTVGSPDANGNAASSTGFVRMRVRSCPLCASPLPPDVLISAGITDVRTKSDLSDYGGELEGRLSLRLTDRYNGPSLDWPATVSDYPFSFAIPCTPSSGSVGSTCSVETSANAILPGLPRDFQRAIWQLGQVQVYDGGADGDADTAGDNTLFAIQGLFAP